MLRTSSIRSVFKAVKQIYRTSSAATPALPSEKNGISEETTVTEENSYSNIPTNNVEKRKSTMVAAAFASLKRPDVKSSTPNKISIDDRISASITPEELLAISQKDSINRKQALKIVTTLAEWSVNGLADMSTFETDPRFVSLCQLLGKSSSGTMVTSGCDPSRYTSQGDLSVVLGISEDDEAAKIASSLSLPQVVKALTSLAIQKKRSLPLLRTLAYNIANSRIELDIKKSADILYSLATLNFPDEVVLDKVSHDLIVMIPKCEKSAVIGSICTSIGRLRYRNDCLLDSLSEWILYNKERCRTQEFVSILITLAIVNHKPSLENNLFDTLISKLDANDLPTASTWLDVVWSLVVLGKANDDHYKSVLSQRFIERISSSHTESSNVAWKKKLLNINGAAKLNASYKDSTLEGNKDIHVVPMVRTKEKQLLVNSVLDALSNILPSAAYLRNNIDTGMGFLIDGECRLDAKMTPFPLIDKKTGQPLVHILGKGQKIAVMCWDYHDNTRGRVCLTGANALFVELLNKSGYTVLSVYYNEYNIKDKLSNRVRFIEGNLKRIIKQNS